MIRISNNKGHIEFLNVRNIHYKVHDIYHCSNMAFENTKFGQFWCHNFYKFIFPVTSDYLSEVTALMCGRSGQVSKWDANELYEILAQSEPIVGIYVLRKFCAGNLRLIDQEPLQWLRARLFYFHCWCTGGLSHVLCRGFGIEHTSVLLYGGQPTPIITRCIFST